MALMIAGLVLFLGLHSLPIVRPVREGILTKVGEVPYRIVYSILSLVGLVMIAEGYKAWKFAGSPVLYDLPTGIAHLGLLLNLLAFVSIASSYGKNHIKKAVKHPMILSVKIWAFAHLLSNGDAASVVLFGGFLAWGVVDRISVKKRERAGLIAPADFAPVWRDTLISVSVGVIVYVLFVWKLHLWLIGVSPLPM